MEAGRRRAEEDARDARTVSGGGALPPQYCYSTSYNTCLYYGGILTPQKYLQVSVIDLMSNDTLASRFRDGTGSERSMSADQFNAKMQELWRTCLL